MLISWGVHETRAIRVLFLSPKFVVKNVVPIKCHLSTIKIQVPFENIELYGCVVTVRCRNAYGTESQFCY